MRFSKQTTVSTARVLSNSNFLTRRAAMLRSCCSASASLSTWRRAPRCRCRVSASIPRCTEIFCQRSSVSRDFLCARCCFLQALSCGSTASRSLPSLPRDLMASISLSRVRQQSSQKHEANRRSAQRLTLFFSLSLSVLRCTHRPNWHAPHVHRRQLLPLKREHIQRASRSNARVSPAALASPMRFFFRWRRCSTLFHISSWRSRGSACLPRFNAEMSTLVTA